MVYKDNYNSSSLAPGRALNERRRFTAWRIPLADPLSRWAALVVDFIVQVPIISLILSSVKKQVLISEWLGKGLDYQVYIIVYVVFAALLIVFYQGLFTAFFGGTPGKLFFGLRVISIWNEERPSVSSSFVRAIYWCLGAFALFLPHLALFYHRERRPIYDRLADTVVVAQEKYAVGPPESSFSGFLKLVLTVFYVGIFVVLTQVLFNTYQTKRPDQSTRLFWQNDQDTCHAISKHLDTKQNLNPNIRIEEALSLYAIGLIDDECLDREADNVLWNYKPTTAAYAAKAMLFIDEKTVFAKYLTKTCEEKKEKDYCLLVRTLKKEASAADTKNQTNDKAYFNLSKSPHKDIRLWALKYWIKEHEYAHALDLMELLSADDLIYSYLNLTRAKALWLTGQAEASRTVLNTFIPTTVGAQKTEMAAWLCYQETLDGCSTKQAKACQKLKTEVLGYANSSLSSDLLIPLVRSAECDGGKNSANYLLHSTNNPRHIQFITAINKSTENPNEAVGLLEDLIRNADTDEKIRAEAILHSVKIKKNESTLDLAINTWKAKRSKFNELWPYVGEILFLELHNRERHQQAYEVGQLISRIKTSSTFLEKWIISSYKSGHDKVAWDTLKTLDPQKSRIPASTSKLDTIRQNLAKRFKP